MTADSHVIERAVDGNYTLEMIMDDGKIDHIDYLDLDVLYCYSILFRKSHPLTDSGCRSHLLRLRRLSPNRKPENPPSPVFILIVFLNMNQVHFGTHHETIHIKLREKFERLGWIKHIDIEDWESFRSRTCGEFLIRGYQVNRQCLIPIKSYGSAWVRDGLLSFLNPKLVNTAKQQ